MVKVGRKLLLISTNVCQVTLDERNFSVQSRKSVGRQGVDQHHNVKRNESENDGLLRNLGHRPRGPEHQPSRRCGECYYVD